MGVVLAVTVCAGCGKKGPPLAPLVPIPAAVELIEANRLGSDVYVTLTIPAANIDEHTPADIGRVEIYGYTGRTAPPRAQWVALATLIATVPVAPPPSPDGVDRADPPKPGEKPAVAPTDPSTPTAPLQGARITVRDTLEPDELVQGKLPRVVPGTRNFEPGTTNVEPGTTNVEPGTTNVEPGTANREPRTEPLNKNLEPGTRNREPLLPLKRFYTAVPFSTRGRPGPPGGVAEFPVVPAPDPPPSLVARYTERSITLAWEPSGGLIGFLLERVLPEEPIPFVEDDIGLGPSPESPGPLAYHVYREILPDTMGPPRPSRPAAGREQPPVPVTPLPVAALEFADSVEFERRRCYTVRGVRGIGPAAQIGEASPAACLTPVDIFPPAAPQSLAAVASQGAISLIWEPSGELDLGGYVVLRGEAPGDTLHPLTAAAVPDARYRDETVRPGVRYVYAVVAVDNRLPLPNMSAESERVEETAR